MVIEHRTLAMMHRLVVPDVLTKVSTIHRRRGRPRKIREYVPAHFPHNGTVYMLSATEAKAFDKSIHGGVVLRKEDHTTSPPSEPQSRSSEPSSVFTNESKDGSECGGSDGGMVRSKVVDADTDHWYEPKIQPQVKPQPQVQPKIQPKDHHSTTEQVPEYLLAYNETFKINTWNTKDLIKRMVAVDATDDGSTNDVGSDDIGIVDGYTVIMQQFKICNKKSTQSMVMVETPPSPSTVEPPSESLSFSTQRSWLVETIDAESGKCSSWIVDTDEYKRPTISPDNFYTDPDGRITIGKSLRNSEFAALLQRFPRLGSDSRRTVVVLDTPMAVTTRTIRAVLPLADLDIHVPNPDPHFMKKAGADFTSMATHHELFLYEWMRDTDVTSCDVGADYCCTIDGNTSCRPFADMDLMMHRRILAPHHGVLWLTFSSRGVAIDRTMAEVPRRISNLARKHKYHLRLETSGSYGAGICYFVFVTFKD